MMGLALILMLVASVVVQVQSMTVDAQTFLRAIVTAWGIRQMPWESAEALVKRMSTTMGCAMRMTLAWGRSTTVEFVTVQVQS
jgi:hypothetical protein